jgi:hypothetical protein
LTSLFMARQELGARESRNPATTHPPAHALLD